MPVPAGLIQLKHNISIAVAGEPLVDVKDYVNMLTIKTQREEVTIPATAGSGRKSKAAGVKSEQVQIKFMSGHQAASFWAVVYEAINTDTAEVDFSGTMSDAAVSADNPMWSGTAVLLSLDTGTDVGALRQQTITLDVTSDGTTVSTIPAGS